MPEGVREEVVQHALDLVGGAVGGDAVADAGLERHLTRARLGLDAAQAGVDEAGQLGVAQLEGQRAAVDPRQLEEVVGQRRERFDLLPERGNVLGRLREPILDRFEHRLHVRERRPQVVARPGDELPARVEESLEAGRHLVESTGEGAQLGRPGLVCPRAELAFREPGGGTGEPPDSRRDGAADDERGGDGGRGGRRGDGEDGQVVAGVEHDEAGEKDGREREQHGDEGEARELQPHRRESYQPEREDEARCERRCRDEEREPDHPTKR